MPADFSGLQAEIDAAVAQVTQTETTEAGAASLITNFSASVDKAVTDALAADNAADQGTIVAMRAALAAVTARYTASAANLGAAVVSGTPSAPPPPAGGDGGNPQG